MSESKKKENIEHLNNEEAFGRIENYIKVAEKTEGGAKQYFAIEPIKQELKAELDKRSANRTTADIHFSQGERKSLLQANHETIKYQREQADQPLRDQMVQKARSEYRKRENLSKWFAKKEARDIGKTLNKRKFREAHLLYLRGYHITKRYSRVAHKFPVRVTKATPHFKEVTEQRNKQTIKTFAPPLIAPEKSKQLSKDFQQASKSKVEKKPLAKQRPKLSKHFDRAKQSIEKEQKVVSFPKKEARKPLSRHFHGQAVSMSMPTPSKQKSRGMSRGR